MLSRIEREKRWESLCGPLSINDPQQFCSGSQVLIGLASSRIGRGAVLQAEICRFVGRSVLQCRQRNGRIMIVAGSAIEPWARQACDLYRVPLVVLAFDSNTAVADIHVKSDGPAPDGGSDIGDHSKLCRDAVLVGMADRLDIAFARKRGKISYLATNRLNQIQDASVRVAVNNHRQCDASRLIQAGAVGWYLSRTDSGLAEGEPALQDDGAKERVVSLIAQHSESGNSESGNWHLQDNQWLIHCTRGVNGPWPDESDSQYRNSMMLGGLTQYGMHLGGTTTAVRGPIDTLCRILRSGRMIASAITSSHQSPVVCFTAMTLDQVLQCRRYRPHVGRWDFEPFGIAIRKTTAIQIGMQPVVYGLDRDKTDLAESELYRFHPLGRTFDWTYEREWRSSQTIDLSQLGPSDVRVFAGDSPEARKRLANCGFRVTWISGQEIVSSSDCLDSDPSSSSQS